MEKQHNILLPSPAMLEGILCADPMIIEDILAFYEPYILTMATESYFDANRNRSGARLNEDLAQEIRLALFRSLPKLREVIIKKQIRGPDQEDSADYSD